MTYKPIALVTGATGGIGGPPLTGCKPEIMLYSPQAAIQKLWTSCGLGA